MSPTPNYILFSDVHLGADLVQHVRPWTVARLKQLARVDRDLASMLDFYREHPDPEHPWCLVIAGDLVDFIGMNIAPRPDATLETALTAEEREHGLGSARDHAVLKMRAVARRHRLVFERLALFLAEGHRLVLVRGNHDLDFHWEAARDAFVRAVQASLPDPATRADVAARIEFHPWFYYVEGLLYVEHGHQFDAMCSYPQLLAPLSPADPRRLSWSFSDWLLRMVSRTTPGLSSEGNADRTALDYVRLAFSLGLVGATRLGFRYLKAVGLAIRRGRAQLGDAARTIRDENDRRMGELASAMRLRIEQLRELAGLWPTPVTGHALRVLRSVFLDRVFFVLATSWTLAVLAVAGLPWWGVAIAAVVLTLPYVGYARWARPRRRRDVDPRDVMREAARRIAELLPARFIVMGHTHDPAVEPLNERATYVNLGHWGVDDLDGDVPEAPRTHLVLRWVDGTHEAELVRWDPGQGPRSFR